VKFDHHEFLPRGQTVNKEYYTEEIKRLQEAVRRKRPDSWREKKWMLHQDNAPANSSQLTRNSRNHETTFVPQLLDSPDLAPADILLFPKHEFTLKG
jgi:hypothetical protein